MKNGPISLKNIFFSFLVAASIASTTFVSSAEAARTCRVVIAGELPGAVELLKIKGSDQLVLKPKTFAKVKTLFAENGVDLTSRKVTEALVAISEHIRKGSDSPSLEKSEKLARIVNIFYDLVSTEFSKDQKLLLGYLVGESVLKMERIQLKKFKKTNIPEVFKKKGVLHINDFHKFVESYIDGTSLYRNLSNEVGFVRWSDIRHLYSNNSWGIGLRDHDMYHLHYAYGHPYYLAINFMSSRGINDRRYALISALWESVDNNQVGIESKISEYFKYRNMTPQEGMIYLARATKEMLDEFEHYESSNRWNNQTAESVVIGYGIGINSGWQPKLVKAGRTSLPEDIEIYDKEIEKFINKSLKKRESIEYKKYYNYHRKGPGKTSAKDEDRIYTESDDD